MPAVQLSELQSGSCGDKIPSAPLRNTCLLAAWMNAYLVSFKTRLEFTSELRKTLGRILLHCLVIFFSVVGCFVLFVLKCHFQVWWKRHSSVLASVKCNICYERLTLVHGLLMFISEVGKPNTIGLCFAAWK